jgi:hypothetical protein
MAGLVDKNSEYNKLDDWARKEWILPNELISAIFSSCTLLSLKAKSRFEKLVPNF